MVGSLARLLSVASLILCAIVIASFAVFVIDETKAASGHQQQQLVNVPERSTAAPKPPGALHQALDEAESAITAPFAGVVTAANGEWGSRAAKLGLALAIYGFGLGFLARVLRVHVWRR